MALLPASVLIGESDDQWLSTAVPLVLQQDLATSASVAGTFVSDSSTAYQLQATEVMRSTVEQRGGRLRVQAVIASMVTQQNRRVLEQEGPVIAGIIPLLDALANKIDPARASTFSSRNNSALKLFTAAVNATDIPSRTSLLDAAVQADANFGLAHIARIENAPQAAQPESLSDLAFTPLDRARWIALRARSRHAALTEQINAQAAVVALAPNNLEALAALGTQQFLAGHASEGETLLRRAMSINPANPAVPIQLVQGFVTASRFSEAAKIISPLTAANANLLPTLALVQLLNRDPAAADQSFRRFISFLPAGNPAIPALEAQWQRFLKPDDNAAPAEPPAYWQNAVQQSGDMNLAARAMYAAALDHAGQSAQTRNVHVLPFIPEFADTNAPLAFNEMRRLTGASYRK